MCMVLGTPVLLSSEQAWQRSKMQKNRIIFLIVYCLAGMLCLVGGCGFRKEVVLEHSVCESSLSSEEEKIPTEEEEPGQSGADETPDRIYVYICGQVTSPGVYSLKADDRVFSLIEMAGGLTSLADETAVNQAMALQDGQMIYVPAEGEMADSPENGTFQTQEASSDEGKTNINTAGLEELMCLPGIGEGKARSILDHRQEHGSFQSIEEIMQVDGIKEGIYTKLKDKITV